MKGIIKYISICLFILCATVVHAQIGVNNPNPDNTSTMDIMSDTSGLLIPRMSDAQRRAIADPGNSLLVFDKSDEMLFFYDTSYNQAAARWTGIGAWRFRDDLSNFDASINNYSRNLYTHRALKYIGLGTQVPTHTLDVIGAMSVGDSTINITDNSLYVQNQLVAKEGIEVNATMRANTYEGYGVAPLGAIVMWSGASNNIPDGWVLCDGSTGYTDHFGAAQTVPDLTGRFIVGVGNSSNGATTYSVGNRGGEETHTLSAAEMTAHNHGGSTVSDGAHTHSYNDRTVTREDVDGTNLSNRGVNGVPDESRTTGSTGNHNHSISSQGGGGAHENRPPYYALSYIIRVK